MKSCVFAMKRRSMKSSSFVAVACRPRPPRLLRAVFGERLRLHVAAVRQRDDHVLGRDQILHREIHAVPDDLRAPRVAELVADRRELVMHHLRDAGGVRENVEKVDDLRHHLFVFVDDLVLLEAREPLQAQFQDCLRLSVGKPVAGWHGVGAPAEFLRQPFGPRRIGGGARSISSTSGERQTLVHQLRLGLGGSRGLP
jgi:hypothetical protein